MPICTECGGVGNAHRLNCSRPDLPQSDWVATTMRQTPDGLEVDLERVPVDKPNDPVNHPGHYTQYQGLEIIDLTEQMNFNKGNAVKYIARAGWKDPDREIEDLEKAIWYTQREIDRIKNRP